MRTRSILGAAAWLVALAFPAAAAERSPRADQEALRVGEAIAERRGRVAELKLIREAAEELGVRVWLFGGTAAGFAHYVRWDLLREAGDPRFRESFFDYDFTTIYRSTQDADLVVDGSPAQAEQLETLIKEKMSFLQGSKDHWEVRLLRQDRVGPGGRLKQALLHNPDFLDQNTDSNSTGMIELTDPPPGESVVRDLRDWESPLPYFLQDLSRGRLHYYRSDRHQETTFFRQGDNPPLFSVIRYLVKAFQYDLAVDGRDLQTIQGIIEAFDPDRDYQGLSPWAKGWLERYGPNLIRHAVNVEYASHTLERLGLKGKLVGLSEPGTVGSLGWWLSREPLRTARVGRGKGRTAAELGIEVVAHETRDFLAYESITRDMTGRPNVLISRPDAPGENAGYGPGFYTLQGRRGARDTGLTVRFRVDPEAREGTDFFVERDGIVRFANRAALRVIPESLEVSLVQYFRMLSHGLKVDPSDRGVWQKLARRIAIRASRVSPAEERQLVAMVTRAIPALAEEQKVFAELPARFTPATRDLPPILREWLALPLSRNHPEILLRMIEAGCPESVVWEILEGPGWSEHPEVVEALLRQEATFAPQAAREVTDLRGEARHLRVRGRWTQRAAKVIPLLGLLGIFHLVPLPTAAGVVAALAAMAGGMVVFQRGRNDLIRAHRLTNQAYDQAQILFRRIGEARADHYLDEALEEGNGRGRESRSAAPAGDAEGESTGGGVTR